MLIASLRSLPLAVLLTAAALPAFAQTIVPIPQASASAGASMTEAPANPAPQVEDRAGERRFGQGRFGQGRFGQGGFGQGRFGESRFGEGRGGDRNPAGRALRAACMADIRSLCGDVQSGGGRIAQCMRGKREQLSQGCKAALLAARHQRQAMGGGQRPRGEGRGWGGQGGMGQGGMGSGMGGGWNGGAQRF